MEMLIYPHKKRIIAIAIVKISELMLPLIIAYGKRF